jgi:hypothetical protein
MKEGRLAFRSGDDAESTRELGDAMLPLDLDFVALGRGQGAVGLRPRWYSARQAHRQQGKLKLYSFAGR